MIRKNLIIAMMEAGADISWVNYPFTTTYGVGIGINGSAQFFNVFTLANEVKLWAMQNGYKIIIKNLSDYDEYENLIYGFSYSVEDITSHKIYEIERFSSTDGIPKDELELKAVFAAGSYIANNLPFEGKEDKIKDKQWQDY